MLDDADNMIAVDQGLVMPFELICLGCSAQGVRVVIPPGGVCSRCQPAALNRNALTAAAGAVPTVFPARPEREPIGCWCLGGLGGEPVRVYGSPPTWLHQAVRRWLFGDLYLEAG